MVYIRDRGKFKQKWVIKGEGGGENNAEVIKQYLQAPAKT